MTEILLFTNNDLWLESIDQRRVQSPEDILSALEDLLDEGEIDEHTLIHYIKRENKMKKTTRTTTLALALGKATLVTRRTPAPPKEPEQKSKPLLTNTGLRYLSAALDKLCDAPHPNFLKAIKKDTRQVHAQIRLAACKAFDATKGEPKTAVITLIQSLKANNRTYIQCLKDLNANCAFNAHMDCVQFTKRFDPEQLDAGIDSMGEGHGASEVASADIADLEQILPREDYAGGDTPEPIATSPEDAYEAIYGIQAWLELAVNGINPEQRQFWGVAGAMPFGQRVTIDEEGEKIYTSINDFDDYREFQTEQYKKKLRAVPLSEDTTNLMAAG